jgi:hypothetical protein
MHPLYLDGAQFRFENGSLQTSSEAPAVLKKNGAAKQEELILC